MDEQVYPLVGPAHHCPMCKSSTPKWEIVREGDVAVSWACRDHLDAVLEALQRVGGGREPGTTRLIVRRLIHD